MSAVPTPTPKRFTAAEYYKLGELGFLGDRTELIHGEILEMPPPGPEHSTVAAKITRQLVRLVSEGYIVRVANPLDLGENQPQPDFALVAGDPDDFRKAHPVTASLVVEVSHSSLLFDREVKSRIYGDAGIPEYWLVDVASRRVEVRTEPRKGLGYANIRLFGPGDQISPAVEPGIALNVDDLI